MNSRRWWLVAGALAVAVTGVLIWLSTSDDALDQGDKLASVTGAVLALAGLVATVVLGRANPRPNPEDAVEDLARLVKRQWEREAGARGLTRQEPLEVRWASTERPVAPSAAEVIGATTAARPTRLKLHGDINDLAGTLHRLPGRQLVVLGEPGSGKTSAAIVVTLSLLAQRQSGDPVPVLLSLASWDPADQDLEAWIAHRISVDHPAFRKRGAHGPEAAKGLVERGLVLPVLDALDEVARKVEAVKGIARMVGRDQPMVLTCRSDDYEEIIRTTGVPVGRAAVVELKPVSADEAARYLEAGTTEGDQRWRPVARALRHNADGSLARALSTPLSVYLAKTAFTPPGTDPAELLKLPTAAAVEQHLLDAYLPALYEDARNARKWLAYLAHRLAASPTASNLAWWRLFLLLPRFHVVVPATRGAVAISAFSLSVVTIGHLTGKFTLPDNGWPFVLWCLRVVMFLCTGAAAGAAIGAFLGLVLSARTRVPLPKYLAVSAGKGILQTVVAALLGAATIGVFGPVMVSGLPLRTSMVVGGLVGLGVFATQFVRFVSADAPAEERADLASDRRTTIGITLWFFTLTTTAVVLTARATSAAEVAQTASLMLPLTFVWPLSGAWVNFTVARFWFAISGRLPWRLVDFLDDAHKRGVLRQVGAAYEFRHQRLQQYFTR